MAKLQDDIDSLFAQDTKRFGISTGLKGLNNTILGFRPAHLIVVGGCSGMGKTSLLSDFALAGAEEIPVGIFSIEMGVQLLEERMLYNKAKINYHSGISGRLHHSDKEILKKAGNDLKKLHPIYIDSVAQTMYPDWLLKNQETSIELQIEKWYEKGCRMFLIDYLQLVQWGFKVESETLRLKNITGKLHNICVNLKVPIIVLSQLKKDVGERHLRNIDPTPCLSDIRDSGYIINDADIIIFLHRPEYFQKKEEPDLFANHIEDAEIIIAKQRNGPTGTVNVKFHSYAMSFTDDTFLGEI